MNLPEWLSPECRLWCERMREALLVKLRNPDATELRGGRAAAHRALLEIGRRARRSEILRHRDDYDLELHAHLFRLTLEDALDEFYGVAPAEAAS